MLNGIYFNKIIIINLIIYSVNILLLYYEIDNLLILNYKKNLINISLLLVFLSGLPVGFVFFLKFQLPLTVSYKSIGIFIFLFIVCNTIYLYFYLNVLLNLNLLKRVKIVYFFKKINNRFTSSSIKLLIIFNILLLLNYNFYLNLV